MLCSSAFPKYKYSNHCSYRIFGLLVDVQALHEAELHVLLEVKTHWLRKELWPLADQLSRHHGIADVSSHHSSNTCAKQPAIVVGMYQMFLLFCVLQRGPLGWKGRREGRVRNIFSLFTHLGPYSRSVLYFPGEKQGSSGNPTLQRQVLFKNCTTSIVSWRLRWLHSCVHHMGKLSICPWIFLSLCHDSLTTAFVTSPWWVSSSISFFPSGCHRFSVPLFLPV